MKKPFKKRIKDALSSYATSIIAFILAIAVCITGAVSYARYVSGGDFFQKPGVGIFAGSGIVNDVSALSFTNMAFWSEFSESNVAMNSLRYVNFAVNNAETDAEGNLKVSDVALEYSLIFTTPENFADRLALQLFDDNGTALTSQFLLSDILNSVGKDKPTASFTTTDPQYNGAVYNGTDGNGNATAYMTFDVSYNTDSGTYTAASRGLDGTIIKIEPLIVPNVKQTLNFRLWDVSEQNSTNVTEERGELLPPVQMEYVSDVPSYRISVSNNDFKFPAGVYTERNYSLSLAPIDTLFDTQLGGYLMQYNSTSGQYEYATELEPNKPVFLYTVMQISSSSNLSREEIKILGNIPRHEVGNKTYNVLGSFSEEMTLENVSLSDSQVTTTIKMTSPDENVENIGGTFLFRKQGSKWYTASSTSNATYEITHTVMKTTTTKTTYNIKVGKSNSVSEIITTKEIKDSGLLILQDGERTTETTYRIKDVIKIVSVETEYELITTYRKKSGGIWTSSTQDTTLSASLKPITPTIPHVHSGAPESVHLNNKSENTGEPSEIEVFISRADVQALIAPTSTSEGFTRTLTYTKNYAKITPTAIIIADPEIATNPFKTHLDSGLQKYFVSTSYSKNYPLFIQVYLQQTEN